MKRREKVIALNRRRRELLDEITHLRQREARTRGNPNSYLSEKIKLGSFRCSVNKTNGLVETNGSEEKSTSISGRRDEYGGSGKQTDLEQKRIYTSSLQCSPSSKLTIRGKSVKIKKCIN